jgi:myo-inositol-1(or 4)-monophosphatase
VVVIDPIDGSLNAKRGIPFFSVSIAVADGPTMGDVHFGYVYDFGTGEEWVGRQGEGATVDGVPLTLKPKDTIEILSFEATRTSLVAQEAPKVAELAYRLRVMGSLALSLSHLAAGRVDAVCSLKPARSVDIAAAQLFVREAGLVIELFDDERSFEAHELDLEGRSRVAAAGTVEVCRQVANALKG